jgi:3-deoxy-7-phosphoheptulonate synthase
MSTSNRRIKSIDPIRPPSALLDELPITPAVDDLVNQSRAIVSDILHARSPRKLVVVGPCSIHDVNAAVEYAHLLMPLRERFGDVLEIVMRVYFEKPRSTVGWKGLINDPDLDRTYQVDKGLRLARKLLLELNELGLPAGTEFLDAVTGQYYADLVSWGAIGARTTESQIHRELASGLSCPVGFKNGTNGNVDIAIDAVLAANAEHSFLSPTEAGNTALFRTEGNSDAHIILRGGTQPNYDAESVGAAAAALKLREIKTGLMIDFSHANSNKDHQRQLIVGQAVAEQLHDQQTSICGFMIESNLREGKQAVVAGKPLSYGVSITDACLSFKQTAGLLEVLANALR